MQSTSRKSSVDRRAYDASRRQADARVRQRRVVDTARTLFLARGYGATSVADIAAAADVSVPFVYAAFESKAGILTRALDLAIAGHDRELAVADRPDYRTGTSAPSLHERVTAVSRIARSAHERGAPLIHLVESARGTDPVLDELAGTVDAALRRDVDGFVRRLPAKMRRRDLTLEQITDLLSALFAARTWTALVEGCHWSPDDYETRMADSVERLLQP